MRKFWNRFLVGVMPFIGMGIFLVLLAVGVVVFSYLLILGAVVGIILFGVFWIYQKFTTPRRPRSPQTIDHDEHH